jgi:putative salt-induced outer membrane protein YdiY
MPRYRSGAGDALLTRVLAIVAIGMAAGSASAADRVVVKGITLEGTVQSVSAAGIVMTTVYGGGEISIAAADIQSIETETVFHVIHGDDAHTMGRVVGLTPDMIRMDESGTPVEIPMSSVLVAVRDAGPDANLFQRMKVALPFWKGNVDLSFGATQATDDSVTAATALGLTRERGPHKTRWEGTWRFGRQNPSDDERSTTANELRGFLRHEYTFAPRWFAYGSADGEYDEVEKLSARTSPKAGLGYRILETESAWLAVDAGGAYVWERYFGGDINQFPGLAFGAESDWKLPFAGAVWHARGDYTPSLEHFRDDYILRGETSLSMPVWKAISFKVSVVDVYDNTPADDTDHNSLSTLAGLSYGF